MHNIHTHRIHVQCVVSCYAWRRRNNERKKKKKEKKKEEKTKRKEKERKKERKKGRRKKRIFTFGFLNFDKGYIAEPIEWI